MRAPVIVPEMGTPDDIGWHPDGAWSMYLGTTWGEPGSGWRGEFIVQKVNPGYIAPGVQGYAIELGAYQPSLEQALADKIGDTGA
jgi:hypothetical protein